MSSLLRQDEIVDVYRQEHNFQSKLQMKITDHKCRICNTATESTTHVLCTYSRIAQSLYKTRHDRMLGVL